MFYNNLQNIGVDSVTIGSYIERTFSLISNFWGTISFDAEVDINLGNLPPAGYAVIAVSSYYLFLLLIAELLKDVGVSFSVAWA